VLELKRDSSQLFENVRLACLQNVNNWLLTMVAIALAEALQEI